MGYGHIMSKNMMKTVNIYNSIWGYIQKQKRCGGEGYLLITKILTIVMVVSIYGESRAQVVQDKTDVKPVMLGFRVPEEFWTHEFTIYENGVYRKQNLEIFRGKPLILDFWATWCTSCMPNFPKLDRFKQMHHDRINFLLVNSYDRDIGKITEIFEGEKFKSFRTKTPSIVFDDYLKRLFPHQAVPIYIWLDDFGVLGATSTSDFVNDAQIKVLIDRMKEEKR
jgi:thiol-disulfide isomerase/thioredoxin